MEDKLFLQLREIVAEFPDGTVFGITRLEHVRKGWVVRIKNATDFEGHQGMMKAVAIARETTMTIAGSKFDELELWDVVEIFESEADATKAAKENDQTVIYQIETNRLKWLK